MPTKNKLQQPELIAQRCACCDIELHDKYSGRHRYTWPISQCQVEICSACQSYIDWGLKGEVASADGTIYRYLYLTHSHVVSFYPFSVTNRSIRGNKKEETGMYCFGRGGPGCNWVTGTKPYPHLEEISAKLSKAIPDLVEKGQNYWPWWEAEKERRGLI